MNLVVVDELLLFVNWIELPLAYTSMDDEVVAVVERANGDEGSTGSTNKEHKQETTTATKNAAHGKGVISLGKLVISLGRWFGPPSNYSVYYVLYSNKNALVVYWRNK